MDGSLPSPELFLRLQGNSETPGLTRQQRPLFELRVGTVAVEDDPFEMLFRLGVIDHINRYLRCV